MSEKSKIQSYRDLLVWQKGMELVRGVYRITRGFPDEEKYGLASQLRRAGVSIPSNIAEGYGRNSTNDYVRFLRMAVGSLYEVQTQLEIAVSEKMISAEAHASLMELANELERMLVSLVKKLANSKTNSDISNNSMG
jgi:four helix bundle protein